MLAAVLGHVGDAGADRVGGRRDADGRAVERGSSPASAGVSPKSVRASSVRPDPDQAGEAEDLAAAEPSA